MASERMQQRIDRLIDRIEAAADQRDWQLALRLSEDVLAVDLSNADATVYLAVAQRNLDSGSSPSQDSPTANTAAATSGQPSSFADGRYKVKSFLGEGGKKSVYLAQDTTLDREVAFALIKTEGLDDTSRARIQREAQAMGRHDEAAGHFEDALSFCRKAGYRPELSWTCCDYAEMLLERNNEGDRAQAMPLL